MLRTMLEQTTHRLVVRKRLPPPFGAARIYASSEGGLRYLRPRLGGVDPPLIRLAKELIQPGHAVWDIGANVGLFSFAASLAVGPRGHVLAVEPDAVLVRMLRRSAAGNLSHAPVSVFPAAVSGEIGVARFHVARRNRSTSHLDGFGTSQTGGIRATDLVPTVTLDWLAEHFPRPDVIKIDVEAAEAQVLIGANDLLRALPIIICEVASPNSIEVSELLGKRGYTIFDGDLPPQARTPMAIAPPNTLAMPNGPG